MSDISDKFLTIQDFQRSQLKVKGSKFITSAFPVENEEQAEKFIQKAKKEFHDATHNCFACRIKSKSEEVSKTSDAKEPKGTAGEQILLAIKSKNLYNVLIVVSRYFGGTKLGKGGLSRAYHQSAVEVLEKCKIIEKLISNKFSVSFPLDLVGKVSQTLDKFHTMVLKRDFQSEAYLEIEVRASQSNKLKKALIEITGGQIKFKK